MADDFPVRLKAEDSPAPADPQAVGIDLMIVLRDIEEEAVHLQRLFTRWGDDPVAVMQRAQNRTVELRALALRAPVLGEQLMQALRAAGVLSASWTRVGGER